MHSAGDEYVLIVAFLSECDSPGEVTSVPALSDAVPCGEHLLLRLMRLVVAALLDIGKAGDVVWSGRYTPQIISNQENSGVSACLIWMCTIQLKLYNELCTIAGWNRSSLNSRNFRTCGMWALFMSFPSYLKLLVWECRKFYHFRHQN